MKHSATTHQIDLISGARPLISASYRAGPKARELKEFEMKRQLAADVIEHSNANWVT